MKWLDDLRANKRRKVFTNIFQGNLWRGTESLSGRGSDLDQTAVIRERLPELIRSLGVRTMLDVPCGDFNWMKELQLDLELYTGGDIVAELIQRNTAAFASDTRRFQVLDLTSDSLPKSDLVLCRDCLVHLPLDDGLRAISNIKASGSTWLLSTTYPSQSENKELPLSVKGWRVLNLQLPPFSFPEAVELIDEKFTVGQATYGDKCLGLWKLADISIG